MPAQILRDYQGSAFEEITRHVRNGVPGILIVAPTGAGKTTIAAAIIERAESRGKSGCFLAHRNELITQCSKRLDEQGIDHGIIKAGNRRINQLPVQVASVQTLKNRLFPKDETLYRYTPPFDYFFIDECHHAKAKTYLRILNAPNYKKCTRFGLTATPCRLDGKGFDDLFQVIVIVSTPSKLINEGYLVRFRYFRGPKTPDRDSIKKIGKEFSAKDAEEKIDTPDLVGDVYQNWANKAKGRKTIVFAESAHHGEHLRDIFLRNGWPTEYLDYHTPEREREDVLSRFNRGETLVLVNITILTEGFDQPDIGCVVIARFTMSLSLHIQMPGRGLRTVYARGMPLDTKEERLAAIRASKKRDCIILDHADNWKEHGLPHWDHEWTLAGGEVSTHTSYSHRTCPSCFAINSTRAAKCRECGIDLMVEVEASLPKTSADMLEEMDLTDEFLLPQESDPPEPEEVEPDPEAQARADAMLRQRELLLDEKTALRELVAIQIRNQYQHNWAISAFHTRFGKWPSSEHGIKKNWEKNESTGEYKLKDWKLDGQPTAA